MVRFKTKCVYLEPLRPIARGRIVHVPRAVGAIDVVGHHLHSKET
jgi:hypothetical protein